MDLVTSFLAGASVEARRQLGKVALVCRLWKDVAVRDVHWRPIVKDLLLEARTAPEERLEGGCRGEVVEYGRCLVQRGVWSGGGEVQKDGGGWGAVRVNRTELHDRA